MIFYIAPASNSGRTSGQREGQGSGQCFSLLLLFMNLGRFLILCLLRGQVGKMMLTNDLVTRIKNNLNFNCIIKKNCQTQFKNQANNYQSVKMS